VYGKLPKQEPLKYADENNGRQISQIWWIFEINHAPPIGCKVFTGIILSIATFGKQFAFNCFRLVVAKQIAATKFIG
jgi:hypothetical protein